MTLLSGTAKRFSLVTAYFGFPLPKARIIFLSWHVRHETPGFLLTCPSSLMEPFAGRHCYPWRDSIFGNSDWSGKANIFSVNKEHPWFISSRSPSWSIGLWWQKFPEKSDGEEATRWPWESWFLRRLPAALIPETSLVTQPGPSSGKRQFFASRARMQTALWDALSTD